MRYARNGPTGATAALRRLALGAAAALVLGAASLAPIPEAAAQQVWVERAEIVEALQIRYDEAPVAIGITEEGALIELFKEAKGATWTLVLTLPNGFSRIVAAGQNWMALPIPVKGQTS